MCSIIILINCCFCCTVRENDKFIKVVKTFIILKLKRNTYFKFKLIMKKLAVLTFKTIYFNRKNID